MTLPKLPEALRPTVHVIGPDDFPHCPVCGRRAKTAFTSVDGVMQPKVVGADEDGPIFRATCNDHGCFDFQVQENDDVSED